MPDHVARDKDGNATVSWRLTCYHGVIFRDNANAPSVDFSVPWDDPRWERWRAKKPKEYCFLGDEYTNVMAVVGKGTAFEAGKKWLTRDLPNDLVLIIEVSGSRAHWMAPVDLDLADLRNIFLGIGESISLGTSDEGYFVGFLDGEVWLLRRDTPGECLLKFCSTESAARYDRDQLLSEFRID